jgi:biopolymer transport protein ExbD
MAFARSGSDSQPMMAMNTTPLIDVMLVLLIMFIMTVPMATHSFDVDLPAGPSTAEIHNLNKLVVTSRDRIVWNGTIVTSRQLAGLLHRTAQMPIEPALQFQPEAGASYDTAAHVMNTIKLSGVTNFGFVGNERFAQFGKASTQ